MEQHRLLGTTYYGCVIDATSGKWQVKHSTDLINWTLDLDYSAQNCGAGYQARMTKAGSNLVVLAPVSAGGHYHIFVFDGSSWQNHDLGFAFGNDTGVLYWDSDQSKIIFSTSTGALYSMNLDGSNMTALVVPYYQTNQMYSGFYSCAKYDKTVI